MEISRNRQFPSFSAPIWGVTGKCQSLGNIRWSIQVLVSQDKEWLWDTWLETEVEIIRNGKDTPENDSGRESWGEMCFSSKASGQETHNRWWFVTQHHICHVCIHDFFGLSIWSGGVLSPKSEGFPALGYWLLSHMNLQLSSPVHPHSIPPDTQVFSLSSVCIHFRQGVPRWLSPAKLTIAVSHHLCSNDSSFS